MKSLRYTVTRPCLQEGSLRLLKYLESSFPQSGPVTFVDDKGEEHAVQVDTDQKRVWGLGGLYHAQNLGVNDVLVITSLAPSRYQVEAVVKPHAPPPPPRRETRPAPETRRVVVSSTPHVREIRLQEVRPEADLNATPEGNEKAGAEVRAEARPELRRATGRHAPERLDFQRLAQIASSVPAAEPLAAPSEGADVSMAGRAAVPAVARPLDVRFPELPAGSSGAGASVTGIPLAAPAASSAARTPRAAPILQAIPTEAEAQLGELARLTGYRLEELGGGVTRLRAELGTHGYSVAVASSAAALKSSAWQEAAEYRVLVTHEHERPDDGTARLTREALVALIEHARLAPLSPIDLRGYWKAGNIDLEAAASVAEFVSSHLAQRGAFSYVLLTLAQQPAHSVISVPRLAEKLGSGVNFAELGSILETLTRAPFLALTPLPGGQYLLRVGVADLLTDLAEYADGVRRRVRTPATRESVLV